MFDSTATLDAGVAAEALAGLNAQPKRLPAWLFYDPRGCDLFGQITGLPEYYVTRTELALLPQVAREVAARTPPRSLLVEYGASSEAKAEFLIRALREPAAYVPIDVAAEALQAMRQRLQHRLPVHPIAADFHNPLALPRHLAAHPALGFFPGSTIGNMEPPEAIRFLRQARMTLGPGALFLVGVDLRKDPAVLLPAYDDAAGVTAAFNMNLLTRLNREAAAEFDPHAFVHQARWNAEESRIEMHLVSTRAQRVRVAGEVIDFAAGESIHTENSYKHTTEGFAALAARGYWRRLAMWTDPQGLFSLHLLTSEE